MTDETGSPLVNTSRERREFVSLMTSRVRDVFLRKPFYVDGSMDLVSLCRALSERGLSEALVRDGGRIGIFTTTDLRDALLGETPPARLPVREVATFDPCSVRPDAELFEALILMLRHRITGWWCARARTRSASSACWASSISWPSWPTTPTSSLWRPSRPPALKN